MMKYDEDVMHRLKRTEGLPLKYPDDRGFFFSLQNITNRYSESIISRRHTYFGFLSSSLRLGRTVARFPITDNK